MHVDRFRIRTRWWTTRIEFQSQVFDVVVPSNRDQLSNKAIVYFCCDGQAVVQVNKKHASWPSATFTSTAGTSGSLRHKGEISLNSLDSYLPIEIEIEKMRYLLSVARIRLCGLNWPARLDVVLEANLQHVATLLPEKSGMTGLVRRKHIPDSASLLLITMLYVNANFLSSE